MNAELTPSLLLAAYRQGFFPMADDRDDIYWYSPDLRTIIDLDGFHVPRTLHQMYRQQKYELVFNRDFEAVIESCADRSEGTWINEDIRDAYVSLHRLGHAHSVEAWRDGQLLGGLYGVSLGGAFFGESMFHRASNTSKLCLVFLVQRMKARRFTLLDTQFTTQHLRQFNCVEVSRAEYFERLDVALQSNCSLVD